MRYFGAHLSISGGFEKALQTACELEINAIQIHPSPPQRWNHKAFAPGAEKAFLAARADSGVKKIFFHAIYLINLATPDLAQAENAKRSLLNYLDFCARLQADGVIVHVGSMKDRPDEEEGYRAVVERIEEILQGSPKDARLILEVAAGSGKVIGSRFEDLSKIYAQLKDQSRVGFGLDTQHMWASGYDLKGDQEAVVSQIESVFGLNKVWSIHLNDSKTELGSRKDRHENFGAGLIGAEALTTFINHKKFEDIPFVLETPNLKDDDTLAVEVANVRAVLRA